MRRGCLKNQGRKNGFTYIEILLSLMIAAMIGGTSVILFRTALVNTSFVLARKEALAQARYAVNRMVQELVRVKPAELLTISQTRIDFKDSVGNNTSFNAQTVGGNTTLYRGVDLLARNLNNVTFKYYDANGVEITNYALVAAVRRISIDMAVKPSDNSGNLRVRGEVYPKNFYYNNFQ